MPRPLTRCARAGLAAGLAALFLLLLGGCGDGTPAGEGTGPATTSSTATGSTSRTSPAQDRPPRTSSRQRPANQGEEGSSAPARRASPPLAPLRVSAGGSAQFRVEGGDNSIAEYGAEAARSELEQAARAVHSYLVARAEHDWSRACSLLSRLELARLAQLGDSSPSPPRRACPPLLAALAAGAEPSAERQLTVVDAASLRAQGDQAFLIYRGAGGTRYSAPMSREAGSWKFSALVPSAF